MLMGQKYHVDRSVILDRVRQECGVDLTQPVAENELLAAMVVLKRVKVEGIAS